MRLPIKARLTFASAILMAVVIGGTALVVRGRLESDLMEAVDAGLRSRAQTFLQRLGSPDALRSGGTLIEPDDAFAQLVRRDGSVVQSSEGIGAQPLFPPRVLAGFRAPRFFNIVLATLEEPEPSRFLVVPTEDGSLLFVGAAIDDQVEALARLSTLLWYWGGGALVLATLVGWLLAGAALRPVERMRGEAAVLSDDRPLGRLSVPGTRDEISRLGETLNGLLERLDGALERERRFVDEASHELRTPLGVLRAELELALSRSRTVEELEAAVRSAAEETERLIRLAEDLLLLARADHGRLTVRPVGVELDVLVEEAIKAAARGGVSIERRIPPGVRANLDPVRMRQALVNLIDNAIRHSPPGGTVTVEAAVEDGTLAIAIRDRGEGFPDGFLAHAFEPFSRSDASRSRAEGGAGLGLAIVRAVAVAHGGSAEASNRPHGGGSVVIRVPM